MATLPEESLIDLLLQLKKTTPDQARIILNSQPQVSYALMDLMIKLNAINIDVFQRILTSYGAAQAPPPSVQPQIPQAPLVPSIAPSAIPPHIVSQQQQQQQPYARGNTPQSNYQQSQPPNYPPYSNGYPPPTSREPVAYPVGGSSLPPHLEALPDEQKAMITQVLSMTPDQVNALPPVERSNILQLRATLGVPVS